VRRSAPFCASHCLWTSCSNHQRKDHTTMTDTPKRKRHFAAVPIPEAAAIDRAATTPPPWPVHGITRDKFLLMLWSNTESHFGTAVDDFKRNAGGEQWEELTRAMYVYQAVQGYCRKHSALDPAEDALLRAVANAPIGRWSRLIYAYVQQLIGDL
jgi:hypothetical protein